MISEIFYKLAQTAIKYSRLCLLRYKNIPCYINAIDKIFSFLNNYFIENVINITVNYSSNLSNAPITWHVIYICCDWRMLSHPAGCVPQKSPKKKKKSLAISTEMASANNVNPMALQAANVCAGSHVSEGNAKKTALPSFYLNKKKNSKKTLELWFCAIWDDIWRNALGIEDLAGHRPTKKCGREKKCCKAN